MTGQLWRKNTDYLGKIYAEFDRNNISRLELVEAVFQAARHLGYVSDIEIITASDGDGAYTAKLNPQKATVLQSIEELQVTTW
jgi:hypothetical protein